MHKRVAFFVPVVIGALFLVRTMTGCGNSTNCGDGGVCPDGGVAGAVTDYLGQVSTVVSGNTVAAQTRTGALTTSTSGPSISQATPSGGAYVRGGSNPIQISLGSAITQLAVAVNGANNYFEITGINVSGGTITITITIALNVSVTTFTLNIAVGNNGTYGPIRSVPIQLNPDAGSGVLTFALTWDIDWDLDLHVVEPGGTEIYYAARQSASGGRLDVDSNAACNLDHLRAEHVTWASGSPPRGTYQVRMDCWSYCAPGGAGPANYTLTASAVGQTPVVRSGSVAQAQCDHGGAGSGTGFSFTY